MKKGSPKKPVLTPADYAALIKRMKAVFPTREELAKHPTREEMHAELKKLPTREEMHATIRIEIDAAKEELMSHIRLLPTKEEFFDRMDALSGEIKAVRQEQIVHAEDHRRINDRFERMDRHLGITTAE